MNLSNPIESIMHYILIGGMTYLSHRDGFPMVSTVACIVMHWIRLIVNHDVRLSIVMIHQATLLHGLSTLRE